MTFKPFIAIVELKICVDPINSAHHQLEKACPFFIPRCQFLLASTRIERNNFKQPISIMLVVTEMDRAIIKLKIFALVQK